MLQRIRVITEELQAIHAEIADHLDPKTQGTQSPMFDEVDAMDFLTDFKGAIDEVRSALWLYIEELSKQPTENLTVKTTHLRRATEMLCALSQHQASNSTSLRAEGSFFDQLEMVMDAHANDYLPGSKTGP